MAVYIYKNSVKYPLLGAKVYQNNSVYTLNAHNKFYVRKGSFIWGYDIADWIDWEPGTYIDVYFKAPDNTMLSIVNALNQEFNHISSSTEWVLMGDGDYQITQIRGTAINKLTSLKLTGGSLYAYIDFTQFSSLYFLDLSFCQIASWTTAERIIDQLISVNIQTTEEKYLNLGALEAASIQFDYVDTLMQTKANTLSSLGWVVLFDLVPASDIPSVE